MKGNKKDSKESILKLAKWILGITGLVLMIAWTGGAFHSKVEAGKIPAAKGIQVPQGAKTYLVELIDVAPRIDVVGTVVN